MDCPTHKITKISGFTVVFYDHIKYMYKNEDLISLHLKFIYMYSSRLMFLKFQRKKCCHKINIGCNGTENNHTFLRACDSLTFVKLKILYKISEFTYS